LKFERRIVDYVLETKFEDIPTAAIATVERMLLADIGTVIAGAEADGCQGAADFYLSQGGKPEASVLLHGGKLPAQNAVFVNAMMSRALDFCDAIAPGPHIGSSTIPTALACAELIGGCTGQEFLAALAIGAEVAARLNLSESAYDGFDPSGICVPFGAAAAACRLLGMGRQQTWNALGLVFNTCGGSFQSHIDGSLGVRVNQGRSAREALVSVRLAERGITGPRNFLTGIYGYLHLYGKGQVTGSDVVDGLGEHYRMQEVAFKKYPCCAMAAGPTEVTLRMQQRHDLDPAAIRSVNLKLPPHGHRLIGQEFNVGANPTVDGQFSAQYCVANVLLRGRSSIRHFTAESVRDPRIRELISRIAVNADRALIPRGQTATDMEIVMADGTVYNGGIDIAPGFPGNPLTDDDHMQRFLDCIDVAPEWFERERVGGLVEFIMAVAEQPDIRSLVELLNGDSSCTAAQSRHQDRPSGMARSRPRIMTGSSN
jgi:2-methylcitrate dehydratase PrpD